MLFSTDQDDFFPDPSLMLRTDRHAFALADGDILMATRLVDFYDRPDHVFWAPYDPQDNTAANEFHVYMVATLKALARKA